MYLDESIQLRRDLPDSLQRDFTELKGYYDEDNWFQFDMLLEEVEASVKAHFLAGKISREELEQIFRKYGVA
jgi:hypothetical protein